MGAPGNRRAVRGFRIGSKVTVNGYAPSPTAHPPEPRMDQAVILARGLGTRMRRNDAEAALDPHQRAVAETGVKALIPVGRPFLDYVLSALADAGYRRVGLVVAPDHEPLRDYYHRQLRLQRLELRFAVQEHPRGTADAVAAARSLCGDEPFLVLNSDNYYPAEALRRLRDEPGCAVALFERESMLAQSNIPADRVRHFSVGQIDRSGFLRRIWRSPTTPRWRRWASRSG